MTSQGRNQRRLLTALLLATLGVAAEQQQERLPAPTVDPPLAASPSAAEQQRELPPAPAVAPPLTAAPTAPAPPSAESPLRPGETVTMRILQVVPADGLSPGERLLNGRNPILPGDRFLAEVIEPPCQAPALVGGSVTKVTRPGWFGRSGFVTLQLAQLIQTVDGHGTLAPWQVDTEDRQLAARVRRALLNALLGLDGIGYGASIGAQMAPPLVNSVWIGGGAAVGLLMGLGYSSFQRGTEASLEPGDTFRIVVGAMTCKPAPRDWQTILHPAPTPGSKKGKDK
jgi:hypothetical protein